MKQFFQFDFLKWFYPGMHIKRWLALTIIGVAIMTFGLSYIVREAYLTGFTLPGFMYYLTLQFIPRYVRGAGFMFGAVGPDPLLDLEAQPVADLGARAQPRHAPRAW